MQGKFGGKVCLVTGAGRGIGQGAALAFAEEGAKVALAARTRDELDATRAAIEAKGGTAEVFVVDVTDRHRVEQAVAEILDLWGAIDVLLNAAGSVGPGGMVHEVDPDRWVRTQQVNLVGTFYTMRSVLPGMIEKRGGRIINVASTASIQPLARYSAYCASKAAVLHLTRVVADEMKPHGITVNAIGVWARTRMWVDQANEAKGGAFAEHLRTAVAADDGPTIEENLPLIKFLAGDEAGHVTGAFIEANGLSHVHLK